MPKPKPQIPLVSLIVAVTRLMGVEGRSPEAEIEFFRHRFSELQNRVQECRELLDREPITGATASRASIKGRPTPGPFGMFVDSLPDRDADWSLPLLEVFDSAQRCEQGLKEYMQQHGDVLQVLLLEGREGRLKFYGRSHPKVRPVQINPDKLTGDLRFDAHRRDLIEDPLALLRRHGIDTGTDKRPTYHGVQVDASDLDLIIDAGFGSASLGAPSEPHEALVARLSEWIFHPDRAWFRELSLEGAAGFQKQVKAANTHFGYHPDMRGLLEDANRTRGFRRPRGRPRRKK